MKKTRGIKREKKSKADLQPEYRFDYSKAKPNRFAAKIQRDCKAVVLDADVARIFSTPESVNAVLRALIETMPRKNSN